MNEFTTTVHTARIQNMAEHQYITASDLKSFYHFGCQLELWKCVHEGHLPQTRGRPSPISLAHIDRGHKWESLLVKQLDEQNLILQYSGNTTFRSQIERDPRNHFYVIKSSFRYRNLFQNEFIARGATPIAFGTLKPDFIEVWKRVVNGRLIIDYHIIDAKASKTVQVAHQAQVYFYWRALQELLPSDVFTPSSTASIWLLNEDSPRPFSPLILKPQMDSFLFSMIPKIVRLPADKVPWHYNSVCQHCSWQNSCRQRTEQEGTISMIPDLSIEDAGFLREVIKLRANGNMTDIEEMDLLVNGGLQIVEQSYPSTATRFRKLMGMKRGEIGRSPVIEAVKSKKPQLLGKPTFHFPQDEDYAVIVSLVLDPSLMSLQPILSAFDISVFHNGLLEKGLTSSGKDNLVQCLARVISSISSKDSRARTQLYCFSPEEISAINQLIVYESLSSDTEDVRICIGAIVDMPSALLTTIQPELLENSLFRSWTKATKRQLEGHLASLGLDTTGTVQVLQERLKTAMTSDNPGLRRLPKVVSLHQAIAELVALPGPGYTTLEQCAQHLLGPCSVPSEDELYTYAQKESNMLMIKLRARGMTIYRIIGSLRNIVQEHYQDISQILVNDAHPLSPAYLQLCDDPNLRKLIFMHEYETLLSLKEMWLERIDLSRPAPLVEFREFVKEGSWHADFTLLEGSNDIEVTDDLKLFDWILSRIGENDLPELIFDDMMFYNSLFPIKKEKWSTQPESVLSNLALALPLSINLSEDKPTISMQLYHSSKFKIVQGQKFRLLRRYVDFNTPKILRNFLEMDISSRTKKSFFLRLLEDPNQVGQRAVSNQPENAREEARLNRLYRQLRDLDIYDATQLVFQRSQRPVMQSILKRQVTIAWGPPGTGKTHTLALSVLYLLEILYLNTTDKVVVWMTAVTNAAIEMFVNKFNFLCDRIRAIPNLNKEWLGELSVLRLTSGAKRELPKTRLILTAGTVWQLWNWNEKRRGMANVVIIDEGGQMNVGTAALAIRWLDDNGRLIVAGDHLQLAPILKGVYPKSDYALFGSILHCLLRDTSMLNPTEEPASSSEIFFQLEENFRMNPQLCNFVELIYQKRFQPIQSRREIANLGLCITEHLSTCHYTPIYGFLEGMAQVMRTGKSSSMRSPLSEVHSKVGTATTLFLLKLIPKLDHFSPSELHVRMESKIVAQLVRELAGAFTEETIFVVTPHRIQRSLVTKELTSYGLPLRSRDAESNEMERIWVDTTERMQGTSRPTFSDSGSEADIVVCIFSHTHMPSLRRDLDFLYNRPRLNVAISRAKTISIVVSSEGVLNPPVEALVDQGNLEGFAYLKAYEDRAWSHDKHLEVSKPKRRKPVFSSQEYDDKEWEARVLESIEDQRKASQGSSQYDDPELITLMQNLET